MGKMLHNKHAELQCEYGCCRTLLRNRRNHKNFNKILRIREKRAWRKEQWA